jgi:hypothetical protein
VAAARRDRRRQDIAKFVEVYRGFGAPAGDAASQAIWVILARHGSKEGATKAVAALWRRFVDTNELRVAKMTEIAYIIERHIKNERIQVAEQIRGFLRTFFKESQSTNFAATESMTPDALKKYVSRLGTHTEEIALALALHYCALEVAEESERAVAEAEGRPYKRPEKELTAAANRLRMLFTFAAHGMATCRAKLVNCSRCVAKAWTYSPQTGTKKAGAKPRTSRARASAKKPARR